jgi:hypothetical protein
MDNKITIIEGPPPTFEVAQEGWVLGLNDSPALADMAVTRLRTFNGEALVERCHKAWRRQEPMHLEFRSMDGLKQEAPIVAARTVDLDGQQMLVLWVRLENEDIELEIDYEDDFGDNEDDDPDFPDLTI